MDPPALAEPAEALVHAMKCGQEEHQLRTLAQPFRYTPVPVPETGLFYSPMHLAAYYGRADVIAGLAEDGFDVDAVGGEGITAFVVAAQQGHVGAMRELQRRGADVDFVMTRSESASESERPAGSESGAEVHGTCTPLTLAVRRGRAGVVEELLALGADPNKRVLVKGNPATPLHIAAMHDACTRIIRALLASGADPRATATLLDRNPSIALTPAHTAVLYSNINATRALVQELGARVLDAPVNPATGDTLLHMAARNENMNACMSLVKLRASIDVRNACGDTPVDLAWKTEHPVLALELVAADRDPASFPFSITAAWAGNAPDN